MSDNLKARIEALEMIVIAFAKQLNQWPNGSPQDLELQVRQAIRDAQLKEKQEPESE